MPLQLPWLPVRLHALPLQPFGLPLQLPGHVGAVFGVLVPVLPGRAVLVSRGEPRLALVASRGLGRRAVGAWWVVVEIGKSHSSCLCLCLCLWLGLPPAVLDLKLPDLKILDL